MILLFDLDDTLVPSSLGYNFALNSVGVDLAEYKTARQQVKDLCPPGYPAARSRRLYFKRYLELTSSFSPSRHLELCEAYEESLAEYLGRAWLSLKRPLLFSRLKPKARKIGIVSNETLSTQVKKLSRIDPKWEIFDFLVTSEEVALEKPGRAIFARALELARATAGETLMIGDDYEMDVQGATAAGLKVVRSVEFTGRNEPTDTDPACPSISSLDELPDFLQRTAGKEP